MRLIDRDALLKKAVPMNYDARFHCVPVKDIKAAPVIERRKKGRWTKDEACPFCGSQPCYDYNILMMSFCPHCGADMREGEQE